MSTTRGSRMALLAVIALTIAAVVRLTSPARPHDPQVSLTVTAEPVQRVIDRVPVLADPGNFESYLKSVYDESGIDARFLIVNQVDGSIEEYGRSAARTLGVGATTGRRGLLFVWDNAGKRLRIEVGPGLEGIITDHFASYLTHDHVRDWVRSGELSLGFRLMLFIVDRRIREAVLGEQYDPRPFDFVREPHRLAAGGGVSAAFPPGTDASVFRRGTTDPMLAAYFAPQPEIEAAWNRYLEWLAGDSHPVDVPLFTPTSRLALDRMPLSRGYADFVLYGMFDKAHQVVQRDSLAMVYYTGTPFISPNFLRLTPEGWRVDIYAETQNSQEWIGAGMTWTLRDSHDEYYARFRDLFVKVGGATRVRYGDNRQLPLHRN